MTVKLDNLQEICDLAVSQVRLIYSHMEPVFLFHSSGMFQETVLTREHPLLSRHPAGKTAWEILDKNKHREQSSFIGLSIDNRPKWFGLVSTDNIIALFNINLDEFADEREAQRTVYHLLWHAIDLVELRRKPEYASRFRNGPMIPKRSPLNLARLNLQADIFSSVMCGLQGQKDIFEELALQRALDSVSPVSARRAEDFPFVISLEAAHYAYGELALMKPAPSRRMGYARQLTLEVSGMFDDAGLKQWWAFSEPAQDMAWRNLSHEDILGCAVYSSEDPFVRATGHLVTDITEIEPNRNAAANGIYNAFIRGSANQLLHRELMEKTFNEAMEQGMREESSQPLRSAANGQNERLAEGLILGWCAHALQAAARAFESALVTGRSPLHAARLEFEGTKDTTDWETLKKIGNAVVDQKRKGFSVTMGKLAELCKTDAALAGVMGSVQITMNDPAFAQKLEAANDFRPRYQPATPQPKGPIPVMPSYAPAAPAPSLGGSAGSSAIRQRMMQERLRQQQEQNKGSGGGDDHKE
jgi:hypothetical protein